MLIKSKKSISLLNLFFICGLPLVLQSCAKRAKQYAKPDLSTVTKLSDKVSVSSADQKDEIAKKVVENGFEPAELNPDFFLKPTLPSAGSDKVELSRKELDEKIRTNSSKDVIYGKSVGGINLSDEYSTSKKILSKSTIGVVDQGSVFVTLHDEGLIIYWSKSKPQTPFRIRITKDYLGSVDFGPELGKVDFSSNGLGKFAKQDPTFKDFARKAYRHFENKDASYDCVAKRTCEVDADHEQYIIVRLPSLTIVFTNDRFNLAWMFFNPSNSPGNIDNNFDLATGSVVFDDKAIAVGDSWSDVDKISEASGSYIGTPDSFIRLHQGVGVTLSVTKSKLEKAYLEPSSDERLESLSFGSSYSKKYLLNKKYIGYKLADDNGKELVLVKLFENNAKNSSELPDGYIYLNAKAESLVEKPKHIQSFIDGLKDLILSELKGKQKTTAIVSKSGLFIPNGIRSFSLSIEYKKNDFVYGMGLSIDEETGKVSVNASGSFNSLTLNLFDNIFSKNYDLTQLKDSNEGLEFLQLGSEYNLGNINFAAGSGKISTGEFSGLVSSISSKTQISVPSLIGDRVNTSYHDVVVAGFGPLSLYLKTDESFNISSESLKTNLFAYSHGIPEAGISGVCGASSITLTPSMSSEDVVDLLSNLKVQSTYIKDSGYKEYLKLSKTINNLLILAEFDIEISLPEEQEQLSKVSPAEIGLREVSNNKKLDYQGLLEELKLKKIELQGNVHASLKSQIEYSKFTDKMLKLDDSISELRSKNSNYLNKLEKLDDNQEDPKRIKLQNSQKKAYEQITNKESQLENLISERTKKYEEASQEVDESLSKLISLNRFVADKLQEVENIKDDQCQFISYMSTNRSGGQTSIYFPLNGYSLRFSENQLSSIFVFTPQK